MDAQLEPFGDDAVFAQPSGATVKCFCRNDVTYRRVAGRWQIATRRISSLMPPQLEGY